MFYRSQAHHAPPIWILAPNIKPRPPPPSTKQDKILNLFTIKAKPLYLTAAALCLLALPAHADKDGRTRSLSKSNVQDFLETMREIGTGENIDMEDADVREYLDKHIADKAHYESAITYEIPGMPRQETQASLTKEQYIETLLNDLPNMQSYEAEVSINDIKITSSGRIADLKTVITESGTLPWGENEDGSPRLIPVKGTSQCDQKVVISLSNYIQMAKAVCTTLIRFDPFAGKELGDPF